MAERKTTINDTAIIKTNAHAMIAGLILCFWFDGQPLKNHASLAWETRGKQLPPGGRWRFRLHMRIGCHHPWRSGRAARCFNKRQPYIVTLRWWLSLTLGLQELPRFQNGEVQWAQAAFFPKEIWKSNFRQYGQMKQAELGRVSEEKESEGKTSERRSQRREGVIRKKVKKEDQSPRKGRKVAKHCVFPMIRGSGGSKSRLAKAAGAEPSGQMRDQKLHAVVARSRLEVKMLTTSHSAWSTVGSWAL